MTELEKLLLDYHQDSVKNLKQMQSWLEPSQETNKRLMKASGKLKRIKKMLGDRNGKR